MTVLDAFAVLALLKGEPAAPEVQNLIEAGDAVFSPPGIAEVVDHLVRIMKTTEEDAVLDLAQLGVPTTGPLDDDQTRRAGLLRARHYHRKDRAVSLADCVAAETARSLNSALATSDPHLLDLCREEGIAIIPLPDSKGDRWSP
ncbi:MAG: PIN domain-containing protein [Acidimicrobiales bacterium]